ncbi:hypothetical protein [Staphylococcus shinii]|uniref:hypothetical protein n=1 Tax=Staphylococcus shinii TaxID=2912228 RepID=UPI003F87B0A0
MKKLKFIIVGLLSATLLLGACGNDEKQDAKEENKQEQKKITKKYEKRKKEAKKEHDKRVTELAQKAKESSKKVQSNQQEANQQQTQEVQQEVPQQPVEQEETLSNINENPSDNRNGYGEDTLSPGYESQAEEDAAFEAYKRGKQAQAEAGPSAVPGADYMDLSDEE